MQAHLDLIAQLLAEGIDQKSGKGKIARWRYAPDIIGNGQAMAMIVMVMRQKLGASPGDPVIRSQVRHALDQHGLFIKS